MTRQFPSAESLALPNRKLARIRPGCVRRKDVQKHTFRGSATVRGSNTRFVSMTSMEGSADQEARTAAGLSIRMDLTSSFDIPDSSSLAVKCVMM